MVNSIGINEVESNKTSEMLNELLGSLQVFRQNMNSVHWNLLGDNFFDLHDLFGGYYEEAQTQIDVVAERVLTLGGTPISTLKESIMKSELSEAGVITSAEKAVARVIEDLKILLTLERKILKRTSDLLDEGTFSIMSGFIKSSEKKIWMLSAWQGKKV